MDTKACTGPVSKWTHRVGGARLVRLSDRTNDRSPTFPGCRQEQRLVADREGSSIRGFRLVVLYLELTRNVLPVIPLPHIRGHIVTHGPLLAAPVQTAGEPAEPEDPQDTTRDNYTETHLITIPKTVADKRGIDR